MSLAFNDRRIALLAALAAAGINTRYGPPTSTASAQIRGRFDGQCPAEKHARLHAAEVKRQRRRVRNLWNHGSGSDYIKAVDRLRLIESMNG